VVLYDRLVAPAILDLCRRDAERVYVGKRRAEHAVPQDQINQLLVDLVLRHCVLRAALAHIDTLSITPAQIQNCR
ncbi:hypothetical protein QCD79_32620, partial [Pseudomonas quasicaspiana]|nr:hypothetical protein [Pseudomonas quasicaspiana]